MRTRVKKWVPWHRPKRLNGVHIPDRLKRLLELNPWLQWKIIWRYGLERGSTDLAFTVLVNHAERSLGRVIVR